MAECSPKLVVGLKSAEPTADVGDASHTAKQVGHPNVGRCHPDWSKRHPTAKRGEPGPAFAETVPHSVEPTLRLGNPSPSRWPSTQRDATKHFGRARPNIGRLHPLPSPSQLCSIPPQLGRVQPRVH